MLRHARIYGIVFISILLSNICKGQGYNPTKHIVANDAIGFSQSTPSDARSMYWDTTFFRWRDFASTAEVLSTLTNTVNRFGGSPIYVHVGGTLSSGVWIGGIRQIWWFKDGTGNGNLVRWYTDSTIVPNAVVYAKRLTDSTFYVARTDSTRDTVLIRGTAAGGSINSLTLAAPSLLFGTPINFSNSLGAWSGTMTLNNQNPNTFFAGPTSGSPSAPTMRQLVVNDLPINIPNGNLLNSSITFGIGTSGTSPNWSTTSPALGSSTVLNIPLVNSLNTGLVTPTQFGYWNQKIDSLTISNDTIYKWANGIRTFQGVVTGGGGGSGTVTNFVFTNGGGIAGVVTNSTTTPTLSLSPSFTGLTFSNGSAFAAATVNSPLTYSAGTLGIQIANTSQSGAISNTDWNTFNTKQNAITLTTTGTTGAATFISNTLNIPQYQGQITLTTTGTSGAATLIGNTLNIPQYAGTTYTFNNGLTNTSGTVQLGGALIQNTTVGTAGFNLLITGLPSKATALGTDSVLLEDISGKVWKLPVPSGGGGSGTVTSFSAGNLSPLFTTSVATATTTPALTFALSNAAANSILGNNTGSSAAPTYFVPTATTLNGWFGGTIQGALTLTTTGSSGASTLIGNTLNIPQYSGGTSPGGVTGNIQFNKLGSFAAVPGANSDTTFGYTSFNLVQGIKEVVAGDSVMPGIVGQVFADPFTGGSLNAAWTSHLTSATLSFPGTYMNVSVSSFSALNGNYIEMNTPEGWIQDTAYFSWTPQDTTSTSYGIGFGSVSHNSFYNRGYLVQLPASSGTFGNKGEIVYYTQDSVGGYTQRFVSSPTAMTIGDTLDVKIARNDSSIVTIQRNRRTAVTLTYTYFYAANNITANNQLPNTGNFRIYFIGGNFHVFNFSVYSPDRKGGVVYVGNSILMGYNTPFWNYRWVSLLHPNNRYIYDLLGGPGDRSIEYLKDTFNLWLHNPKLVYWCGTENDLNGSLGPATTATNLQAFITSCKNHNTPVVVIGGAPQTGKLIKPYNDSAQAVAGRNNVTYVNVYDTLRSGTDYNPAFSTDGVHPNQPGHAAYATQVSKQDPNFSYSILRADNMGTYSDANSRYVIFSPTSPYGLTAGRRLIDSPIYFHQTPTTADSGTLFTMGALHIGAKPESQLNNAVSWIVGNGQSTSQIFAVQGLNAGDYPGMEIVDNLGNRTGFYYQANGGAAFNPGYMVTESNVAGKGIRFIGGLGTARGSDYDMEVDSLSVKMQHNLLLPNIPNKTSLLGTDSVLVKDNTGKVFSAATSLIGGGGTPGGANTQIQFNNSGAFGGSANLTWNGTTLTTNALAISTYAAAGANDSVLTWDAASKSVRMRSGIFNLYAGNGMNFTGGDTVNWGGTLALNTVISGAGFSIAFGTSGSNLGGFSITGGKYNSSQGAQVLGSASTINNAITAASGSVTNFSAYAFLAPTVTSTNTGVTYSHPSTLYIDAAPTMSTNSTASNAVYALNVNSGGVHFGLGASNISATIDGAVSIGVSGSPSNAYLLEIGASSSSQSSLRLDVGTDPTSPGGGSMWNNGTNLYFVDGNANNEDLLDGPRDRVTETSAATLTLSYSFNFYAFTGTTTTWTLPSRTARPGMKIKIKNAGSGNITLNADSGTDIYDTGAVSSITIAPGTARVLTAGPTFWYVN